MDDYSEVIAEIREQHTNLGDPCDHCGHRFAYDNCVGCGDVWPCAAIRLVDAITS